MNGADDKQNSVSLPEGLRRQFAGLERRLWRVESAEPAGVAGIGLVVSYLALFVSDRIWDSPVALRVGIASASVALVAGTLLWWAKRWIFQRRNLRALSVLVQEKYRRLGDRLLGIVELTEEQHHLPDFSPALYRAAIHQVATEAAEYDFEEAISSRRAKRCLIALGGLVAVLLLPVLLVPTAAGNAFARWVLPVASIERFTLVNLEQLPAEKIVAHGEPFEVSCAVTYRSFWKPSRIVARYGRQPGVEAAVTDGQVRLRVPAQVEAGTLRIRVGDAVRRVAVQPTHRPSLKELAARVELPAYLQYPPQEEKIQHGALALLEGSRVAFRGRANRPLTDAQLQLAGAAPQPLKLQESEFLTEALTLEGVPHCAFTWKDQFGLESSGPWRLAIQPQKDAAPIPELPDLAREVAILETEVLEVNVAAKDDFGVRELGLKWETATDAPATNDLARQEFNTKSASAKEKKLERAFRFSPLVLKIPADTMVELRAVATDFLPDRESSESPAYRVHVLGNERHAELVRQKLESLLVQLEEVTRLEEKIADTTRDVKEMPEQKLAAAETAQKLGEMKDSQTQNAANLEELAKEGMRTLREALRNPTIPQETLREWSKNLQAMQELAQGEMQQASKSLSAAQQNADARAQEAGKALEQEQAALEGLEKLQKKVNQNLDQLQALTLAQRLRKLGAQEKDIEIKLEKVVPETIGMLPRELPAWFKRVNENLATDQEDTGKESQSLHGELSRFFERTQQENYGQVSKEMKEARTGEELERVRDLIRENVAMQAMQGLGQWSKRFNDWAELLEPKKDSSGGGGGEGGGGEDLTKQLIALLRLRDKEVNLREQTGIVAQKKDDKEVYRGLAWFLSANQGKLREELGGIQEQIPLAMLEPPMRETAEAMQEAEGILKRPQTDEAAHKAETQSIDLLTDVINLIVEQAQPSAGGEQSQGEEEMAFLMLMMAQQAGEKPGMTVGPRGGGSLAGGSTDRRATPATGDPRSKSGEGRRVSRAGGRQQNLPSEFREALEGYFNAIE
ncbi:MAG: hypothetical protein HYY24_15335 [Verrucomicrobia bacterium]|nr:hypothetical protein [Verrucomicrobiota bacterium]